MRYSRLLLAGALVAAGLGLSAPLPVDAQDYDDDDAYDEAFTADRGGPVEDPALGGEEVYGGAVGNAPIGGPAVMGGPVENGPVGGRALGGGPVMDPSLGGQPLGGGPVGNAPLEGQPLY